MRNEPCKQYSEKELQQSAWVVQKEMRKMAFVKMYI